MDCPNIVCTSSWTLRIIWVCLVRPNFISFIFSFRGIHTRIHTYIYSTSVYIYGCVNSSEAEYERNEIRSHQTQTQIIYIYIWTFSVQIQNYNWILLNWLGFYGPPLLYWSNHKYFYAALDCMKTFIQARDSICWVPFSHLYSLQTLLVAIRGRRTWIVKTGFIISPRDF